MLENEHFVDPIPGRPLHHAAILKNGDRCCSDPVKDHPYAFELYTNRVKYYTED